MKALLIIWLLSSNLCAQTPDRPQEILALPRLPSTDARQLAIYPTPPETLQSVKKQAKRRVHRKRRAGGFTEVTR
jgi:hypothetical protein